MNNIIFDQETGQTAILPGSWKNFAGRETRTPDGKRIINREGERYFNLEIKDKELADKLVADGFNVKEFHSKREGRETDEPTLYLKVKVKFNDWGPQINLYTEGNPEPVVITADTAIMLDEANIIDSIVEVRPYQWEADGIGNGKGTTAYLNKLSVTIQANRFDERFR